MAARLFLQMRSPTDSPHISKSILCVHPHTFILHVHICTIGPEPQRTMKGFSCTRFRKWGFTEASRRLLSASVSNPLGNFRSGFAVCQPCLESQITGFKPLTVLHNRLLCSVRKFFQKTLRSDRFVFRGHVERPRNVVDHRYERWRGNT